MEYEGPNGERVTVGGPGQAYRLAAGPAPVPVTRAVTGPERTWKPLEPVSSDEVGYLLNPFRLYRCPVCGATVDRDGIDAHEDWHDTV